MNGAAETAAPEVDLRRGRVRIQVEARAVLRPARGHIVMNFCFGVEPDNRTYTAGVKTNGQ